MKNTKIKKARSRRNRRNDRRAARAISHSVNFLGDPTADTFYDPRLYPQEPQTKWGRQSGYIK